MILKLLSTVREIRWENASGEILARMARRQGRVQLSGSVPTAAHWQVVVYNDGRENDRTFIASKPEPAFSLSRQ